MPLSGDFARLRQVERGLQDLTRTNGRAQRTIGQAVGREVQGLLREQHARGIAPEGTPWPATARGKPALLSRKIPGSFSRSIAAGAVAFRSEIDWLSAHHEGHVFPPRAVADRAVILRFNRKGRLVSERRFKRLKRGVAVFARAHAIRQRVLPPRPIYPTGSIPSRWATAINRGALEGMQRWYQRATR